MSYLLFFAALKQFRWPVAAAYAVTVIIAVAMHYMALFLLVGQGLALLVLRWMDRPPGTAALTRVWGALIVLLIASIVAFHAVVTRQINEPMQWLSGFDPRLLLQAAAALIGNAWFAVALVALALLGAYRGLKDPALRGAAVILCVWVLADITCVYAWGFARDQHLPGRYLLGPVPALILLAANGADYLGRLRWLASAVVVLCSVLVLAERHYYTAHPKQDFRAVVLFVEDKDGCVVAPYYLPVLLNAYARMLEADVHVANESAECGADEPVWVVKGPWPDPPTVFPSGGQLAATWSFHGGLSVARYDR